MLVILAITQISIDSRIMMRYHKGEKYDRDF